MKKVITIFATCAMSLITLGILNIFNIPHKDIIFTFVSVLILLGGSFILKSIFTGESPKTLPSSM